MGLGGLVIGFILAFFVIRASSGNVRKQLQTQSELKQVRHEVDEQKAKIEAHFAESADLMKSLAQDYQKLYKHLASSSVNLLAEDKSKALFNQTALLAPVESKDVTLEGEIASTTEITTNEQEPPKDYSKGSSGLLKNEQK
ncbi:YhcB family protein [Pasteurellaceae bacterium NCTC 11878]|nr:YhcB family protein [Spirabiliibacterium falconis]